MRRKVAHTGCPKNDVHTTLLRGWLNVHETNMEMLLHQSNFISN
jgi:hypothetical protein